MVDAFAVAEVLNYSDKSNWIAVSDSYLDDASRVPGVKGYYAINTSPGDYDFLRIQKVIYIAEAQDADEARRIHKDLWNIGDAPFLIVILAGQIRVYSCFSFSQFEDIAILSIDSLSLDIISESLSSFNASNIDSGNVWSEWSESLDVDQRVDRHLLTSLSRLSLNLINERGLSPSVAHSLIGKYIYIRYLRDRNIISDKWLESLDLKIDGILGKDSNVRDLVALISALEERFSGRIFPIDFNRIDAPTDEDINFVASIFRGDLVGGQPTLGFEMYDFSHIPIEMLSSIYEQFIHIEDEADISGAFYTPEPLADYLISELNVFNTLRLGHKIIDPSCGSGVFLVLCYKRLIRIAMIEKGDRLSPEELRSILETSIYGVERNREACYVTEFSLILMLLNFLDPPDLESNRNFRFPQLHNRRIFNSDFFDPRGGFVKDLKTYDWVIGNPPWLEIDSKSDPLNSKFVKPWIEKNIKHKPVARYRTSEAFLWLCSELVKDSGHIGLLIQASSLTNQQSEDFRRKFFSSHRVFKVTNFANLAYTLFSGRAQEPTASVVYKPRSSLGAKELELHNNWKILHFGPMVANQLVIRDQIGKQSWNITISESEIDNIDHFKIEDGDSLAWKMALWGTPRDQFTLSELAELMPESLSNLCKNYKWDLALGLQLRDSSDKGNNIRLDSLSDVRIFDGKEFKKSKKRYIVPAHCLKAHSKTYVRKRGGFAGLATLKAPHIVLGFNASPYSDTDFILPHPVAAVSAKQGSEKYLKALSVYLSSSIARYLMFFSSPTWGNSRTVFNKADAERILVPTLDDKNSQQLSDLYDHLARLESQEFPISPIDYDHIDQEVASILNIPDYIHIITSEFIKFRIKYNKGVVPSFTHLTPSEDDIRKYTELLSSELNEYSGIKHSISTYIFDNFVVCSIEMLEGEKIDPGIGTSNQDRERISTLVTSIMSSRYSQWLYVQKSIKIFTDDRFLYIKPRRKSEWLATSAMNDSDDIINEMIHYGSTLNSTDVSINASEL